MSYRTRLLLLCIGAAVSIGSSAGDINEPVQFDASRLRTGTFVYRDVRGDQEIGRGEISVKKLPGTENFSFSDLETGEFSQRWTAITTTSFHPISAKLSFNEGLPVFELTYTTDRVTGFLVKSKGPGAGSRRSIDDKVPGDIVDQRVDWAAVSASNLEPGREFEFDVYDPSLGVSHVVVRAGAAQSITVPAGRFKVFRATYEINKRTGVEKYQVFVTTAEPRMLVREEFPDGTASDLVSTDRG
jgi:hypothetical protein